MSLATCLWRAFDVKSSEMSSADGFSKCSFFHFFTSSHFFLFESFSFNINLELWLFKLSILSLLSIFQLFSESDESDGFDLKSKVVACA